MEPKLLEGAPGRGCTRSPAVVAPDTDRSARRHHPSQTTPPAVNAALDQTTHCLHHALLILITVDNIALERGVYRFLGPITSKSLKTKSGSDNLYYDNLALSRLESTRWLFLRVIPLLSFRQ